MFPPAMHAVSRAAQHHFRPGHSITPPHACRHRHRPPNPNGNGGVFTTPLGTVALWVGLLPAVAVVGQVPKNTQKAGEHPPSAQEAVKRISVPPGFQVTLFAAEPDVRQPIAIDLDDRGRLWVAQCDTYEGGPYDTNYDDQILILEDTDGDGIHDRRVNRDRIELATSGYQGRHAPDFLFANSLWFRGVSLEYGPDGDVYLSDWSDYGECHDHDGVHRTSGRIYKICYGSPRSVQVDLGTADARQLVDFLSHPNAWYARHARRRLQELAGGGQKSSIPVARLTRMLSQDAKPQATRPNPESGTANSVPSTKTIRDRQSTLVRLRAMWTLYSIGELDNRTLLDSLRDPSPHVRKWAVRLIVDKTKVDSEERNALIATARHEPHIAVRLHLASALSRIPPADRWPLALSLLANPKADSDDNPFGLMLWYGIEPAVAADPMTAIEQLSGLPAGRLRRFVARRIAENWPSDSTIELSERERAAFALLSAAASSSDAGLQQDVLEGITAALAGRVRLRAADQWNDWHRKLADSPAPRVRLLAGELHQRLASAPSAETLRRIVLDKSVATPNRRQALRTLARAHARDAAELLPKIAADKLLEAEVILSLRTVFDRELFQHIVRRYPWIKHESRQALIETAASRPEYARIYLQAMALSNG